MRRAVSYVQPVWVACSRPALPDATFSGNPSHGFAIAQHSARAVPGPGIGPIIVQCQRPSFFCSQNTSTSKDMIQPPLDRPILYAPLFMETAHARETNARSCRAHRGCEHLAYCTTTTGWYRFNNCTEHPSS